MDTSFIHLHCHSNFSFLDSVATIDSLVERAALLRMSHLALTDHNTIAGLVEFYEKARARDIHPILGSQVNLECGGTVVLIIKNAEGYANLCHLLTEGHLRGGHSGFILDIRSVLRHHRGLIALSGGRKGSISRFLSRRRVNDAIEEARRWKRAFGEDFYLELQKFEPSDEILNYKLMDVGKILGIPLAATNDVHFTRAEEYSLQKVVHAIDHNTTLQRVIYDGFREQYLTSTGEMKKKFSRYPEVCIFTSGAVMY